MMAEELVESKLHQAVRKNELETITRLIKKGSFVDIQDHVGRTPLHLSVEMNHRMAAEILIDSKCDLNLRDNSGRTPLLRAASLNSRRIMELLLARGARVDCADHGQWTLLHHACFYGWVDIVQCILVRHLVNVNVPTKLGWTPLMLAISRSMSNQVCEEMASLIINAGADVNQRDNRKMTALHWASYGGQTKVCQTLLSNKELDLNPQDENGETPLHRACCWKRRGVIKQLLMAGADTNVQNKDRVTVLSVVLKIKNPSLEEIKLFVEHNAFFKDSDYAFILKDPFLKENLLKDADLCTKSTVNKFHHQTLPSLYSRPYFKQILPSIENFKLNSQQVDEVENFVVKPDIESNAYCNLVKAYPIALSALCVKTLLASKHE